MTWDNDRLVTLRQINVAFELTRSISSGNTLLLSLGQPRNDMRFCTRERITFTDGNADNYWRHSFEVGGYSERLFDVRSVERRYRHADHAGSKAHPKGRQHEVLRRQPAVGLHEATILACANHDQCGCSVERIKICLLAKSQTATRTMQLSQQGTRQVQM